MQTKDAARRHIPKQNKRSVLAIEQPTQQLTQQSDVVAIEQPTQQLDAAALNSRTSARLEHVKTATQQIDVYHSPESNRISMQTNWMSHCLNSFSAIDFVLPAFIQTLKLYRQQHNRSTLAIPRMQTKDRCIQRLYQTAWTSFLPLTFMCHRLCFCHRLWFCQTLNI